MLTTILRRPRHTVLSNIVQSSICCRRRLTVLGIETSCDDTSVAILNVPSTLTERATLPFHERITANNIQYGGIEPITSLRSHRQHLAPLIQRALLAHPTKPDIIAVTRGPGMLSSLDVGLQTAKGLAVAWDIPLVAVNHMQAHALTSRLCDALDGRREPMKPFASLLISGGHTMLVYSKSVTEHEIVANTVDIAIGDALDKCARAILPASMLADAKDVSYGRLLEEFVFGKRIEPLPAPSVLSSSVLSGFFGTLREVLQKVVPSMSAASQSTADREAEMYGNNKLGKLNPLMISQPWENKKKRKKMVDLAWSFASFPSQTATIMKTLQAHSGSVVGSRSGEQKLDEDKQRLLLGFNVMRGAFQHLTKRTLLFVDGICKNGGNIDSLVVSGGVASNRYLRYMLTELRNDACGDAESDVHFDLKFPPVDLCTDNAAMIAWVGYEMYQAGYESELDIQPFRKWWLDPKHGEEVREDGKFVAESASGILEAPGWKKRELPSPMRPSIDLGVTNDSSNNLTIR